MFLDLHHGGGRLIGSLVGALWETDSRLLGAPSTHNFGECPRDVEESTLSQILEANVDPKYYLSATACRGVLRRAVNRGKELPTLLKIALCLQGKLTADEIRKMGIFREGEIMSCDGAKVYDARGNGDGKIVPTLTGGHEDRVTDYTAIVVGLDAFNQSETGDKAKSLTQHGDSDGLPCVIVFNLLQDPIPQDGITPCLSAGNSENGQAMLGICYIDYAAFNQGVNAKYDFGVDDKTAFTLTGKGPGAVCFAIGNGQADQLGLHEKAGALNCMHDEQAVLFVGINGDKAGTLDGSYYKGCGAREGTEREIVACAVAERRLIYVYVYVRRLTPTECARLQGMPDWWCADVPHADAPEYKMWGNGMALPNILYVMEGIAERGKEKTA